MSPTPDDRSALPAAPILSRRDFLSTTAAAGALGLVAPLAVGRESPPAPPTLKVGLVGCGGRGSGAALQAVSAEHGTVELTAMGDLFMDRVDAALKNLKEAAGPEQAARIAVADDRRFAGFDAVDKVLASGVDVVILTTPPHFRPEHLKKAIAAGKHVFCEKPIAVDAPGVRSVLESAAEAKQKGLALVTGFCWRYNVRHRELYQRIHDGQIGEVRAIYSTYNASPLATHKRRPEWSDVEFQCRNWQHFQWLSGDHIVEQAVHSLDKMAWTMKDVAPLSCTAVGGRQARVGEESGNVYDHFSATFEYPNGAKAFHMCRQIANCSNDNSDYVYGTKGTATIQGFIPLHQIDGEKPWTYEGDGNDMYQQEHDELFASIRSGKPINDGVWMAHSTLLAIMARMAAYTGQSISWEQALNSTERLGPKQYHLGPFAAEPVAIPGVTRFA